MEINEPTFLHTITDRAGTITRVHRLAREFYDIDIGSGGIHEVITGDFYRWYYPRDAQIELIDPRTIPGGHLFAHTIAADLRALKTGDVPAWARQKPPGHVEDVVITLAHEHGLVARLDGPHSEMLPFAAGQGPAGRDTHWRICLMRDGTNNVIAQVGAELMFPDTGGEACTLWAWSRETDVDGERTGRYADIALPEHQVGRLHEGIAEHLATAPIAYP